MYVIKTDTASTIAATTMIPATGPALNTEECVAVDPILSSDTLMVFAKTIPL